MENDQNEVKAKGASMPVIAGVIVLLLVVAVGAYLLMSNRSISTEVSDITDEMAQDLPSAPDMEVSETTEEEADNIVDISVEADEFSFSPAEITVNEGETVRITLTNVGTMSHDFVIDEFAGARTRELEPGESETVVFTPDGVGEYNFYCSIVDHRAMGMEGTLIVE